MFGACCGTFDYRSGMYTFPVTCLSFSTALLLWLGKDFTCVRSKPQRYEKENRKAELMVTPKTANEQSKRLMPFSKLSLFPYYDRVLGFFVVVFCFSFVCLFVCLEYSYRGSSSSWIRFGKESSVVLEIKQRLTEGSSSLRPLMGDGCLQPVMGSTTEARIKCCSSREKPNPA